MSRSNSTCAICRSFLKDQIDLFLAEGLSGREVFEEALALFGDLPESKELLKFSALDIDLHDQRHRLWRDRQVFKQPQLYVGDVITDTNFLQAKPHTLLGKHIHNLIFKNCNLTNCDVPKGTKTRTCTGNQISHCSHLNPKMPIDTCADDCEHCVEHMPEVVIEGRIVARDARHYRNKPVD